MPERCSQSRVFPTLDNNVRVLEGGQRPLAVRTAHAARVAAAQWGAIHHRQLRECGIARDTISRWVAAGRLHPRYPDVYAFGHPALPVEGELAAALLAVGAGATLSHATAAWWWGLVENRPTVIDISVSGQRRCSSGLRLHRRRHLQTVSHRRLPVTPVIQTLLDFAADASVDEVRRALAEAEYRRLVEIALVSEALGRGRPGAATLRAALRRHQPQLARTRSELEKAFLALCESEDIPVPEFNTKVCGYRVDAVWREQRVVVELDGLDNHRTPAQLQRDHQRDLVLRRNGFETRRYTWEQVTREREHVVADLPRTVYQR